VSATAPQSVVALAVDQRPTLGTGRLVCIDGPAGSGKSTLAAGIRKLTRCRVVHMDDLYPGWSGLPEIDAQLESLLTPLSQDEVGHYRRYDWGAGRFAETVAVAPAPLLVLEGVGSGASRFADLVTILVWVDAPNDVRRARGLTRDGDTFAPHWEQWARDEALLFTRERTRERADVRVDGTRHQPS